MFRGEACAHPVSGDGSRGIGFQCVMGRADLVVKPGFDGAVTRE